MPFEANKQPKNYLTATIGNGQTVSGIVDLGGATPVGLFIPAEFDGTTLTFQASPDGQASTFVAVKDTAGNPVSLTVAASTFVRFDSTFLTGIRYLRLVAGTAQGTTDTVLTLATRTFN